MIRRRVANGELTGDSLTGIETGVAQNPSPTVPIGVNQAVACAVLEGDAMQLHLPLTGPAPNELRLVAELLSTASVPSTEILIDLAVGKSEASPEKYLFPMRPCGDVSRDRMRSGFEGYSSKCR